MKIEKSQTQEEMVILLESMGIKTKLQTHRLKNEPEKFCQRYICFSIEEIEYQIEWYWNECTLYIGNSIWSPSIPFKHMYLDTTFPIGAEHKNRSIGFAYSKTEQSFPFVKFFYPYDVLRIPVKDEITKEVK